MYTHKGPSLFLAEDMTTVVPENDPRARFLLIADGQEMSDEDAAKHGLVTKSKAPDAPAMTDEKAKADTAENKARQEPPTNKAKG